MTERAQFEAMLEALINEDQETARDIFHNIVVGKSREIYEELLESDFGPDEDESEDDSFDDESEDDSFDDETFGDEDEDGELADRVLDLEDALEELKAEFDELLAGEENEEENFPGIHGDEGNDDFGGEGDFDGEGEFGSDESEEDDEYQQFMEYVNKVALPKHGGNGEQTKSVFNKPKYNDMGGTTANIARGDVETKGGTKGGLSNPKPTVDDFGNINKPGANAGKTAFKKQVKGGHGSEKKGAGEKSVNSKSPIKGR